MGMQSALSNKGHMVSFSFMMAVDLHLLKGLREDFAI